MLGEFVPYAGMATGIIVTWIVLKIVTAASEGDKHKASVTDQLAADVERLRAEIGTVLDVAERVQELEERQEFTERMLARERERPRLDAGG